MRTLKIDLNNIYKGQRTEEERIQQIKKRLNSKNLTPVSRGGFTSDLNAAISNLEDSKLTARSRCESILTEIETKLPGRVVYVTPDEVELTLTDLRSIQILNQRATRYRLGLGASKLSPTLDMELPLKDGYMKPWIEQTATTAFMVCNPRGYILNDTRTGKSLASIHACHALMELDEIDCAVFVTTLSGGVSTFPREFESLYGDNDQVSYIIGNAATRALAAAKNVKYYVTNHDALKTAEKELTALVKRRRVAFVIDEVTALGNPDAAITKAAIHITAPCRYVWGMTGTPDNAEKIFGFTKVINPIQNPHRKSRYMEMCYDINRDSHVKRLKTGWERHVEEIMQPSIRIPRRDLLGPPEVIHVAVPLPEKLQGRYDKFLKDGVLEIDGRMTIGDTANILKGKLMQMANGFLEADAPIENAIETPERYQALFDIIDKTQRKVVVFASYRAILPKLRQVLYEKYPLFEVGLVNGSVTGKKRGEIMKEFTNQETNMRVLLAHPETCAHSLEFAGVSDTLVYYGAVTVGSEIFSQASDRVRSRLQSSPRTFMYHIYSTEEEKLTVNATYKKVDVNFDLLKRFQQVKKDVMDRLADEAKG